MSDIGALLDEQGLSYEQDADGEYRIIIPFTDGRDQLVLISGTPVEHGDTLLRHISSQGCPNANDLKPAVLRGCLKHNCSNPIGSWELEYDSLVFKAKLLDNMTAAELYDVVKYVATTADEFEKYCFGDQDTL